MKITVSLGTLLLLAISSLITQNGQVLGQSEQINKQTNQSSTVPSAPVLGYLEMRDQRIAIKRGVYTIYTRDGKVLAEDVTLQQLQANYPSLHKLLEDAIAADEQILDASMRINQ